jgi:hypothetical protein
LFQVYNCKCAALKVVVVIITTTLIIFAQGEKRMLESILRKPIRQPTIFVSYFKIEF